MVKGGAVDIPIFKNAGAFALLPMLLNIMQVFCNRGLDSSLDCQG